MSTDKNGKKKGKSHRTCLLGMYYTAWLPLAVTDIFSYAAEAD